MNYPNKRGNIQWRSLTFYSAFGIFLYFALESLQRFIWLSFVPSYQGFSKWFKQYSATYANFWLERRSSKSFTIRFLMTGTYILSVSSLKLGVNSRKFDPQLWKVAGFDKLASFYDFWLNFINSQENRNAASKRSKDFS